MMLLETSRLILRKFKLADFEVFAALMADRDVMEFSLNGPMSREEAKTAFHQNILTHYRKYGLGLEAAILKEENKIIGLAGLKHQIVDDEDKIELGYRFLPAYWGQGLAFEAGKAILEYAFHQLNLKEIISIIEPANIRSIRLAQRLGMQLQKQTFFHHLPVHIYARPDSSNS